jgi:NAD(P)-dependent dehydrogenase (short-subunit alcohol dehydrogenase family)
MKGIAERVAIVTGGSSGIGAGLVRAFVAAGARVMIADILDKEGAALADELGSRCRFQRTDLRHDGDIDGLVTATVAAFGGIDFLINAAATYVENGAASDRAQWRNGFDINVIGHVMLAQRARDHLKLSPAPSIVNFTSESAHVGLAERWVYPATKAAIEQVTRSEALDLAVDGIRVNSVMPGWTEKPWQKTAPQEVKDRYASWADRLHMLGRLGRLDEVADAVLFLCSEHASFMTGSCLRVDGGHSAMGPQGRDRVLPSDLRRSAGVALAGAPESAKE